MSSSFRTYFKRHFLYGFFIFFSFGGGVQRKDPLIFSQETRWDIIKNILEPDEGKSLNNRFPCSFIHLNALEIPYPLKVIPEAGRKVPLGFWKGESASGSSPIYTSQELLSSSDEAGFKTSRRQHLQFLSTNLLLSVNFEYGTFLRWSRTLLAGNQFHNTNNVTQSGCLVPLHHVSYNFVPRTFRKIPSSWEQSCVSWSSSSSLSWQ